jgi:alkylhydroperoxidase/carboxymuconolactone decarboxylase family protein YurZ
MAERSDTPVLDLLSSMTGDSLERSTLDAEKLMIARLAALVAMDAPPVSYLVNLAAMEEAEIDTEAIQETFIAIAPIVGTARIASAAGKIVRALGLAVAVVDEKLPADE